MVSTWFLLRPGDQGAVVPTTVASWVRGRDIVDEDPVKLKEKYGIKIIHQSWKSEKIPAGKMTSNFITWSKYHPGALHVLWTDEDNLLMVEKHYKEFLETYKMLPMEVMRSDMARVLYMVRDQRFFIPLSGVDVLIDFFSPQHRYGGLYVDLDYEAKSDLFSQLPKTEAQIYVVESPTLMNEVMQNSLMLCKVLKHEFWYEVCKSIVEIQRFLNHPEECKKHGWSGCDSMMMFHSRFTGKAANLIFILDITGPAVLDKTWVLHQHNKYDKSWQIELLPLQTFFVGTVARHYQFSTWVNIPWAIKEGNVCCFVLFCVVFFCSVFVVVIVSLVFGILLAFAVGVGGTYFLMTREKRRLEKMRFS